jgi:hypothetical protein
VFVLGEIRIAAGCSRRSTRFIAEIRKLAAEPDADANRILASPAVIAGNEMLAMIATIVTTTSISIIVTPDRRARQRRLAIGPRLSTCLTSGTIISS